MSELKCSLMNLQTWLKSWNLPTAESDAGSQSRQKQDISKPSLDLVFFRRSLLLLVIAWDVLGDEDVDDLQREHRAELLLGHARLDELALRHRSVVVLVHLVERWKWATWTCESQEYTWSHLSWQAPPGWPYLHLSRWSTKKDPWLSSEAPDAKRWCQNLIKFDSLSMLSSRRY